MPVANVLPPWGSIMLFVASHRLPQGWTAYVVCDGVDASLIGKLDFGPGSMAFHQNCKDMLQGTEQGPGVSLRILRTPAVEACTGLSRRWIRTFVASHCRRLDGVSDACPFEPTQQQAPRLLVADTTVAVPLR